MVTAHIDTSVLVPIFSEDRPQERSARRLLERLRDKNLEPVVSQIVVGELVAVMLKNLSHIPKEKEVNFLSKIYTYFEPAAIKPVTIDSVKYATRLIDLDLRIGPVDALIVAQALLDRDSQYLLTFDTQLVVSKSIRQLDEEVRNKGIREHQLYVTSEL